jgi:hypothetical protein
MVKALKDPRRTEPPKDGLGEREMLEAWVFGRPGRAGLSALPALQPPGTRRRQGRCGLLCCRATP